MTDLDEKELRRMVAVLSALAKGMGVIAIEHCPADHPDWAKVRELMAMAEREFPDIPAGLRIH